MADTSRSLRALIKQHRGEVATKGGFPVEVRERVGRHIRRRRQAGVHWSKLATELGLSPATMTNWMKAVPEPQSVFLPVPVEKRTQPPLANLTVTSPAGWRIDGLNIDQLAQLIAVMR